jgi:putative NIF3 family GTP cyclohydrolase 1 type 2
VSGTTRRRFLWGGVSLAAGAALPLRGDEKRILTAAEVVDRIKARVGIPWAPDTVDRIVAGGPETPVRGIATTMMSTLEVLQKAAAAGRNLVITHEPTFYSHQDRTEALAGDPTFQHKRDHIARHGMAVFRFHDHWHRMTPDGIAVGMARELGWEKHAEAGNPRQFVLPEVTLGRLVQEMKARLQVRTLRVVGDPAFPVRRVAASWGYAAGSSLVGQHLDADLIVVGETWEWELVPYVQDRIASGRKAALVVVNHVVSEQAGMKYCAEWLKAFVPEVPVEFVAAPEPFWLPSPG